MYLIGRICANIELNLDHKFFNISRYSAVEQYSETIRDYLSTPSDVSLPVFIRTQTGSRWDASTVEI